MKNTLDYHTSRYYEPDTVKTILHGSHAVIHDKQIAGCLARNLMFWKKLTSKMMNFWWYENEKFTNTSEQIIYGP